MISNEHQAPPQLLPEQLPLLPGKADCRGPDREVLGSAPRSGRTLRCRGFRAAGAAGETGSAAVVDRFCERVAEYQATVTRVRADELPATVAALCRARGAQRIAVPPGGPDMLAGVEIVVDAPPLSAQALDRLDGVLTGCALAIAETGTIVLDGGERSGRRALTLVPDWHMCIVEAPTIVGGVPDAVAVLADAAAEGRPITLVSGPSATSDIELDRVEGVHGPRTLDVIVVSP